MKKGFFRRERRRDRSELPAAALKKQLEKFAEEGDFKAVMLATGNGFLSIDNGSGMGVNQLTEIDKVIWNLSKEIYNAQVLKDTQQFILRNESGSAFFSYFFVVKKQLIALIFLSELNINHTKLVTKAAGGISRIILGE